MTIADCKALAERDGHQAAVILTVARDGTVTVSSWGEPGNRSRAIGRWAQGLWDLAVAVVPFRTVFGWGNGGIPKPLTDEEVAALSEAGRQYAYEFDEPDDEEQGA